MLAPMITKFVFRIRTRGGLVVDSLMIHGQDESDAERKLRQIYHGCEVLECVCHTAASRTTATNYEEVLGLIAR